MQTMLSTKKAFGIFLAVLLIVILVPVIRVEPALTASEPRLPATSKETWNKTYGGPKDQVAYALVQTSDGGYALAGWTDSFGIGVNNAWLVKTDQNGNVLWNKTYGGTGSNQAYSMVQTSDGGYALAGYSNSYGPFGSFWLVKTDASGNTEWNKTYGASVEEAFYATAYSLIQTSDGGYALAGEKEFFTGNADAWLVKTDASGNMEWNKTYGETDYSGAGCVIQTSDGGYALAGWTRSLVAAGGTAAWLIKTDANGNMLWNKTYGGISNDGAWSVIQTSDGGYALAGYTLSYGAGSDDFWLIKTDATGKMLWSKTYGGKSTDDAHTVVQTSDGGYALAGYTASFGPGTINFWLVKTDANGNTLWSNTYGGKLENEAYAMIQTSDGGYALAGYTNSYGTGREDFLLVKTNANGGLSQSPFLLLLVLVGVSVGVIIAAVLLLMIRTKRKSQRSRKEPTSLPKSDEPEAVLQNFHAHAAITFSLLNV